MLQVLLDRVPQVLQVWLEPQVLLVYREIKGQLVLQGPQVLLVYKAYKDLLVF